DGAAQILAISTKAVRKLIESGVLRARQPVPYAPWVISHEQLADERVRGAVEAIKLRRKVPAEMAERVQHREPLSLFFQQLEEIAGLEVTVALAQGVEGCTAATHAVRPTLLLADFAGDLEVIGVLVGWSVRRLGRGRGRPA